MPLEIHPLTPADLEAWIRMHYIAHTNAAVGCFWAREPSIESFSTVAQSRGEELLKPEPNSNAVYMKVIDTDLDQHFDVKGWRNEPGRPRATSNLVAVAKWHVYERERSEEEVRAGFTLPAPFPEERREARAKFMKGIYDARWAIMGTQPHLILETLITHPDQQRRGAGGMLVRWGNKKADELGLVSYLDASEEGRPLYEKLGFVAVRDIPCDLTEFGGWMDTHVSMVRQPQKSSKHPGLD